MARYKVTLTITEGKRRTQKRGEREHLRYRILKMLTAGVTQDAQGRISGGESLADLG